MGKETEGFYAERMERARMRQRRNAREVSESAPAAETPRPVSLSEAVYRTGGLSGPSQHQLGVRLVHIKPDEPIMPKMTTDEGDDVSASTGGAAGQEALAICPVCERSVDRMCDAKAVQRGNDWYHGPCSRFASRSTPAAQTDETPRKDGKYFGLCPKCGVLLGFGHFPEKCNGEIASGRGEPRWEQNAATAASLGADGQGPSLRNEPLATLSERTLDEERAEFEEWYLNKFRDGGRCDISIKNAFSYRTEQGDYGYSDMQYRWDGWLAARGKETR